MTRRQMDDYINYENGSQHPFSGGGLYLGRVVGVDAGKRASVKIPSLGLTISTCPTTNTTAASSLREGDSVVCGFLENDNQEVVVLGRINITPDVYPTLAQFMSLQSTVNSLVNTVNNLDGRVSALENA